MVNGTQAYLTKESFIKILYVGCSLVKLVNSTMPPEGYLFKLGLSLTGTNK